MGDWAKQCFALCGRRSPKAGRRTGRNGVAVTAPRSPFLSGPLRPPPFSSAVLQNRRKIKIPQRDSRKAGRSFLALRRRFLNRAQSQTFLNWRRSHEFPENCFLGQILRVFESDSRRLIPLQSQPPQRGSLLLPLPRGRPCALPPRCPAPTQSSARLPPRWKGSHSRLWLPSLC